MFKSLIALSALCASMATIAGPEPSASFEVEELRVGLSSPGTGMYAVAMAYTLGLADATRGFAHCAPVGLAPQDVSGAVLQSILAAKGAGLSKSADWIVVKGLANAWPCRPQTH